MRAASRDLNIASSAVNRQILLLEDAIGMRLFERTGRRLILTETGHLLLRHVQETAFGHGEVMSAIDALRGIRSGRVRISVVESISTALLPGIVAGFRECYPDIHITMTVTGSEGVADMVLERQSDVGLTFKAAQSRGLEVIYRASLLIGAVVHCHHPLAERNQVSLAECFEHSVAYPARSLSIRPLLDEALQAGGIRRPAAMEANSLRVMSALARNGNCVAFQTVVGIERDLADGTLIFIPVNDKALVSNEFQLVRRSGREISPATGAFIEYATPCLREALPK